MRLAVIQVRQDGESRATNMTRIGHVLARAADHDPPPDLIVLPGRCDAARADHVAGQACVRETIAFRAREWGVFVAAGLFRGSASCAVLFDADGDIVADTSSCHGDKGAATAMPIASYASPLGRIGVLDPRRIRDRPCHFPNAGALDVVCVPMFFNNGADRAVARDVVACISAKAPVAGGVGWAVACPADVDGNGSDEPACVSFVRSADGVTLAEAADSGETILFADLHAAVRSTAARSQSSSTLHKRGGY